MRRFFVCGDHSGDIERLLEETGITVQVDLHVQMIISFLEAEGDETTAAPLKPLKQSGKLRIEMKIEIVFESEARGWPKTSTPSR